MATKDSDPKNAPLSPRERRFVDEYIVDLKGARAAVAAGYGARSAHVTASRLLRKANIQAAIEAAFAARQQRTHATADATVRELARVAYSDISAYFDDSGRLRPLHELSPDQRAAIASVKVVRKNLTSGDGCVEYVHEIKLWSKPRALETLGKHQGLFREEGAPPPAPAPAFVLPADTPGVSVH
jgi:phage terminase small subunit